jgi:NitT/TauT family transport system substrate-binding protein
MTCRTSLAAAFVLGLSGPVAAQGLTQTLTQGLTEVTFGTNWLAQGEHGGYYQALADGTYERYGLKVTIVPGGPRANNRMLMAAGRLDFYMGGNLIQAFAAAEKDIPTIVVAAHFQKDPQALMSHPGQGLDTFQDLRRSNSLLISKDGFATVSTRRPSSPIRSRSSRATRRPTP